MAVTVAICGLVRNPELFLDQLRQLTELQAQGAIESVYYSTWRGEVERYPALYPALRAAGAVLIEAPEPTGYSGPHHFYLQTAVLRRVLNRLPPDRIVLRLRPDIIFAQRIPLGPLVRYLEREIAIPTATLGNLSRRIFVGTLNMIHPFWLEDRYFAGRADDLAVLADSRMDFDHFAHTGAAIAEVRWFSRPFVDRYRAVREMMRVNWLLAADPTRGGRGADFRALLTRDADLQRFLALYHHILERSFLVGLPPELFIADPLVDEPEPMPCHPGALERFAATIHAGPAYREALAAVRADETLLTSGFDDERALAASLLRLGSALMPVPLTRGPDEYGTNSVEPLPTAFAWGVAAASKGAVAGQPLGLAVAWHNDGPRVAEHPAQAQIVARWFMAKGRVLSAEPLPVDGLRKPSGEWQGQCSTPAISGLHALEVTLRTGDGTLIGDAKRIEIMLRAR